MEFVVLGGDLEGAVVGAVEIRIETELELAGDFEALFEAIGELNLSSLAGDDAAIDDDFLGMEEGEDCDFHEEHLEGLPVAPRGVMLY